MIVTLLTDYGRDDDFVGVCHGVIRGIGPDLDILDITHGIRRYSVRQGALVLRNTLPYMPVGVHLAVVDPQVGTERRALALAQRGERGHHGLEAVVDAEFAHGVAQVGLDGFGPQGQASGWLRVAAPQRHLRQDVDFPG